MERRSFPFDFDQSPEARSAKAVAERLRGKGHQAVLAGGAVRDLLLGREPKDFDIATDAHPEAVLDCFTRTRKVGIAFGVVLVREFEATVEVATFRADLDYVDGRRPEGVVFTDAATDAQRRDFTVNGLFYDIANQEVIDHVGGLPDLPAKTIRAIGLPEQRFGEDYLRLLRAIRFSVSLDFEIEPITWQALCDGSSNIAHIAFDRIHEECRRTFSHGKSERALHQLVSSGLWPVICPEAFDEHQKPLPTWNLSVSPELELPEALSSHHGELSAVLGLCLQHITSRETIEDICNKLRCTNTEKQIVIDLGRTLRALPDFNEMDLTERKRLLRQHQHHELCFAMLRSPACSGAHAQVLSDLQAWTHDDLWPNFLPQGRDLIAMGVKPGPHMGDWLEELENDALNGKIKNREEADARIRERIAASSLES
jgi:tRNA nucleotidyltransferase/poly(A) polymerase